MKKVELLAPAGSFESFKAAIRAGADAVYIGGKRFGARAYAANFSDEDVCRAISYGHLFGRKLYLTVNTLVKEEELKDLVDYMLPFYRAGLDGVIVQDFGVFQVCKEHFPGLELHASTQMTISDVYGARLLKEMGACRIVPSRELSLEEIKTIKEETGLEIEAFIHGAMCYCYSGACLFSSMLGGRSGNRGRCAQPCRQPYQVKASGSAQALATQSLYALSLKDMCSIDLIPELIEGGIDSFKIEGRMKKPEYVAGVTALYRKYIDRYYANPKATFRVSEMDQQILSQLYVRSELQDGYYHRHNGVEMVTLSKPGYAGVSEKLIDQIRETYLAEDISYPVRGEFYAEPGMPSSLTITDARGNCICAVGAEVMQAQKQPLTIQSVEKQLLKTGDTPFRFETLDLQIGENCFIPVRELNQLRRDALDEMFHLLTEDLERLAREVPVQTKVKSEKEETTPSQKQGAFSPNPEKPYLALQVETIEQLMEGFTWKYLNRIYVPEHLAEQISVQEQLHDWKSQGADRTVYYMMPFILRTYDEPYLAQVKELLVGRSLFDGALARSYDSYYFLHSIGKDGFEGNIQTDASIYVWNSRAKEFWMEREKVGLTLPYECNHRELIRMGMGGMEYIVYGRIPLMISANCIKKTGLSCNKADRFQKVYHPMELLDRFQVAFPAQTVCRHCYNVIYNSVPLSLHDKALEILEENPSGVRVVLTDETGEDLRRVRECYEDFCFAPGRVRDFDAPFTRGHYRNSVE